MSISFAATPQAKEAQQARAYTDPSAGAPPSRRSGSNAPYVDRDHWNRVFTDQTYFDSLAKQKGMAEGAKVSLHGDDYVYRQAMMGYLSATRNVPLDDMRSIFDAEKDGFAQKVLGKQTASAREMFDWQKGQFERSNKKKAAADQILQGVIRRSLEDALSGGDTPFVESVGKDIDAASEMFDDEEKSRLWEKAEELDMKIRASQAKFAPEARFIFDALQQSTGQKTGFGAPDMREMAARFAQLPDAQRQAVYELAGGFAQLAQTDKGFWYQMAESLGRGASDIVERVPRNFREQTLRGQLRLLESEQPVFRAAGAGGAEFSAAGNAPVFGATQGQMLTPEEREQAKAKIQSDLGVLRVERELRDLAERVIDPIQTVTFLPDWIEEGLYGAARSIPYTAAAAVPFAGIPAVASALFSANYDRIMLEYPDLDPDKAALIAAISAPIEAGLERMKLNTITGRLPIVGGLIKRLKHPNQRNLTRIMIGAGGVLAEQNIQETIQELTFPVVQTIAAALDADMPDYDWEERLAGMPRELAVQFVALLPLSLMGVGALSYREIKRGENYLKSKADLEKVGYSPEQIDRITGAESAEAAQAALVEEHGKRDPKLVKAAAQRVVDEVLALREKSNPAALPRLEKQGADYVVLSPEGKELARTTDQTAAEQALVSARRETVQREMRDVHTGINEAVAFIQKVNEARQRGEDVAKVIREEAPRTLLDDYEANPTQENLDRLFETVRAFGQEINEPAELANFPVTGSNQGALREGIWRSIIRINEGADGTIVMREFAQDNLKRAISEGRTTLDFVRQQLNDILPQIDSARMERQLRTETDTDVIEAFSDIALAYFRGSIRDEQIPAGLRGIIRRLAIVTRDIFRRAYNLARLRAEGKLDRDFEALLAEAVGVDQQALVDRARERTEQEVAPEVANYSIGTPDKDGVVRESDDTTEAGTLAPDADLTTLDPDQQQGKDWQDVPWEQSEKNYSIAPAVLPEAFPVLDKALYNQILAETDTTAAIHIDRLRVGEYGGVMLQGGMYFPAIVENLKQGVVWAFNSKGVASAVAERARANGGYVKLVLMLEGNVIGNKTFATIWFKQLRKNIKAGKVTTEQALAEINAIRERYVTRPVKGVTTKFTGHDKPFTTLKQAEKALMEMPQIKRGNSYFQKTSTVTKRDGEKMSYQSLLSQAMTAKGFPDAAKIVESIEEPAFKGLPKGTIVGLIKIDPDAVPMTAAEAGVTEHISYGYVLKGKPVARMAKHQSIDALYPQISGKLMSQQAMDFPASQVLNYSIGSRAQPDVERNVVTLPDVTISGPANYSIQAWHASPYKYDKADLSKAGTGEGAAVYGWGFYMAENPAVSGDGGAYQLQFQRDFDTGKRPRVTVNGKPVTASNVVEFIDDLSSKTYYTLVEYFMAQRSGDFARYSERVKKEDWDAALAEGVQLNEPQIYNVEADVEQGELLDWDKPLSEQSESVQEAFDAVVRKVASEEDIIAWEKSDPTGAQAYSVLAQFVGTPDRENPEMVPDAKYASLRLRQAGVKGIRYLDQGSRGTPTIGKSGSKFVVFLQSDQGTPFDTREEAEAFAEANQTYNYVIFDDSLIKILTRNGEQISVEQAAQETQNYSISTQSEIDRVGAALNRLDRDPLERVKIYEKAQEKFLRVMADNREMLAGMQDGDLAQMRRTQILQALGELDGIISVLPPEVRAKIGGYTQLAKVDPMDVFKGDQKVSEVRGMSGAIISAWMREGLNIGEAQKKTALPDGYRAERNLEPTRADRAIADVFIGRVERINRVLEKFLRDEYNDAAVELFKRAKPQRSGAGEKPKGKLGADVHDLFDTLKEATEWSAEQAQAWADGQWARIENAELNPYEETYAQMAAQMVPLFADWANADSSQRAAAVTMGKDVLNRAYKGEQQRIVAMRTKRGYDRTDLSNDAGVAAEDDVARNERAAKENSLPSTFEGVTLNLLNFEQVLSYIFGENSAVARRLSNAQRKADNAKDDGIISLSEDWASFTSRLAGKAMTGDQLVYELSQKTAKIGDLAFSQNELIAITMMWMQPKGRQHMEGFLDSDGQPAGGWHYGQDFVNKAERLLTPEAKAVREYLLAKYDAEYEAINKVYRKVYGLNLPKNQFYSPLVVESIKAPSNTGIDPVTGAVFSAAANAPSALRSRGGAIAQPVFHDAVQTYLGHMMQMEHWKAYAEFNSEAAALLGHRDTRNVIAAKGGEQAATVVNGWLNFFNQGGNKEASSHLAITRLFNNMLGRASTMALFGRIGTLVIQSTQLGAAAAKMPVAAYMTRFAKLMSGQLGWGAALDSPYIQRRIKQMPPQVQVGMMGLRGDKPSKIREAARQVGWLISGLDGLFTAGTYAIIYDYQMTQLAKSGITGAEAEAIAREEAERTTDEVAQPTRSGARSLYELTATNPLMRVAWAFSSEARKNLGLLLFSAAKRSKVDLARAALYVVIFNGVLATIIRSALRDIRDGDDEELFDEKNWSAKRLLGMVITEPLYGFPVVGEVFERAIFSALGVYKPDGSLFDVQGAVPAAKRIPSNLADLIEGEADYRVIMRDVNRLLSAAGLFNGTIAGAASLSNLAKDIFEATEANLPE
jgi:hypothetical protein